MGALPHITESEWLIMNQLWEKSPLTAAEIVKRVQVEKNLVATTVKTLLRRLIAKEAVAFTVDPKNSKLYYYSPLVTEKECVVEKSKHFLSLYYKDDIEKMLTTFVDSSNLSDEELQHLADLLKRKRGDADE